MTVLNRDGDHFTARNEGPDYVREIRGTFRGNRISWSHRDTRVIKGPPPDPNQNLWGTLQGNQLLMQRPGGINVFQLKTK